MRLRRVGASPEHRPRRAWSTCSTWASVRPPRRTSSPATTQRRTSCIVVDEAPGFLLAIMLLNISTGRGRQEKASLVVFRVPEKLLQGCCSVSDTSRVIARARSLC